jgi:zinc D-Ala-D-Ala dipeptidase
MPLKHAWKNILILLYLTSCTAGPSERRTAIVPHQAIAKARAYGLVDVREAIPDIVVDLRYATAQNVAQRPIYPRLMPCLLRASTLERLKKAQATLRLQGYGIRIWDAWRPPEAQQVLYANGGRTGLFLAPSTGWSRHCGGISLDATLVDRDGREQRMPTYFDEDLEKAASTSRPNDPEVQRNLERFHQAMRSAGLKPLDGEWWHFDDEDYLRNPVPVITAASLGIVIQ